MSRLYFGDSYTTPEEELKNFLTERNSPAANELAFENRILVHNSMKHTLGAVSISGLASQCGIAVVHNMMLPETKEHQQELWSKVYRVAKALRYSNLMATLTASQRLAHKQLESEGFSQVFRSKNYRSGNTIAVYVKDMNDMY